MPQRIPDNPEAEVFFAAHCAMPGHLVMAAHFDDGKLTNGIFSSFAKAVAWAETFDKGSTVFGPCVIDEPEFGNVTSTNLN